MNQHPVFIPSQQNVGNQNHGNQPNNFYQQPRVRSAIPPQGARGQSHNVNAGANVSSVPNQGQMYQQQVLVPNQPMMSMNQIHPYPPRQSYSFPMVNSQQYGQYQPYTPAMYPHHYPTVMMQSQPISAQQQYSQHVPSSMPASVSLTQPQTQPVAPPPRKKNLIKIQDPTSGCDVTNDILSNASSSSKQTSETSGNVSSSSSARATPPDNSVTPPPSKGASSSAIAAQFATQVAAVAVSTTKEPAKELSVKSEPDVASIPDKQTNVKPISNDEVDSTMTVNKASVVPPVVSTEDIKSASMATGVACAPLNNVCDESVPVKSQLEPVNVDSASSNSQIETNIVSNGDISNEKLVTDATSPDDGHKNKKSKGKQRVRDLNEKGKEKEGGDMDAFLDSTPAQSDECQNAVASVPTAEDTPKDSVSATVDSSMTVPQQSQQPNNVPAPTTNSVIDNIPAHINAMVARKNEENLKASQSEHEEEPEVFHANDNDDEDALSDPSIPKLKYEYKEDQWSPINTEGKKQYDRIFLIKLQTTKLSLKKPEGLPDLEVIKDKPNSSSTKPSFDFTPGYVQSSKSRGSMQSTPRRSSQQGRNPPTKRINLSINTEIKLHESENAWKPGALKAKAAEDPEKNVIDELVKAARGILNKLTPQKFDTLVKQIIELSIDTPEKLAALISLIFEKALDEPSFSVAYASLCHRLCKIKVKMPDGSDKLFRVMLLTNCQKEFEKDNEKSIDKEKQLKLIEEAESEEKKKELTESLQEAIKAAKRRTLGNIRFIGELYKLQILTGKIMHDCIQKLLKNHESDEDSLECLCRLLTTLGKEYELESQNSKKNKQGVPMLPKLDATFAELSKMVAARKTSSRVRFMMQDVIDLRANGWIPRREDFNPKTIDEIHQEAAREALAQQIALNNADNAKRMDDRGSRRSRGAGPPSISSHQTSDDGWSTVHNKSRFLDTSKIRQIQSNFDENNIQLGPCSQGFKPWGAGSSGGSKSNPDAGDMRPPAIPNNRFNALSSGDIDDARVNYTPRSGASSRESSMNRQSQQGTNGHRKISQTRGSSKERKELLNSVSNMTKSSNTAAAQRSRESSANRKFSRPEAKQAAPPAKEMSEEEFEKKTGNIIDEFLHHGDSDEVVIELKALNSPQLLHMFTSHAVNKVLERSDKARSQIAHLLDHVVKKNVISIDQYVAGMNETLEYSEDLLVDIPRFWDYVGEMIAPMIHNDKSSLLFLVDLAKPLYPRDLAGNLVAAVLHTAAKALGAVMLSNLWKSSGLKWTQFVKPDQIDQFIDKHELGFLEQSVPIDPPAKLDMNVVQEKFEQLLMHRKASNEEIMNWIDGNVGVNNAKDPSFIRALMTKVCESVLTMSKGAYTVDKEAFKKRTILLQKYLDNDEKLELQALFAVQRLLHRLEHPSGVCRVLLDMIYDEEVISEDAFTQWENNDNPNEQEGHAVLMKSLTQFFTWLHETDKDDQNDGSA